MRLVALIRRRGAAVQAQSSLEVQSQRRWRTSDPQLDAVAARIKVLMMLLWSDDESPGQSDDVAPLRAAPTLGLTLGSTKMIKILIPKSGNIASVPWPDDAAPVKLAERQYSGNQRTKVRSRRWQVRRWCKANTTPDNEPESEDDDKSDLKVQFIYSSSPRTMIALILPADDNPVPMTQLRQRWCKVQRRWFKLRSRRQ